MTDAEVHHVIWLSGQSWDSVSGSDRSMAVALSRYAPLLWVDSPTSPVTRGPVAPMPLASRALPRISTISGRITRLTTVALPGMTRPGVRSTTPNMVRSQVKWAMRQLRITPTAVIMGYLGDLLGGWGDGVMNVLYGTDDWVAGARLTGLSVRNLLARERRALARADMVVAVTPQLSARWADLGTSARIIPNGCWPDEGDAPPAPAALANLPRPVVGLVGYLGNRIDMDILIAIAEAGLTLLLVGDKDPHWQERRFLELSRKPNVRRVGPIPSYEVRSYMSAIDIGITPYELSPFNMASFPLKTLEYLGSGIPVVSTSLPASHWLYDDLYSTMSETIADQVLLLADSTAEFLSAIQRLSSDGTSMNSTRPKNCIEFAERHSWTRRAADFAVAIGIA